jgi:hypothetical protein
MQNGNAFLQLLVYLLVFALVMVPVVWSGFNWDSLKTRLERYQNIAEQEAKKARQHEINYRYGLFRRQESFTEMMKSFEYMHLMPKEQKRFLRDQRDWADFALYHMHQAKACKERAEYYGMKAFEIKEALEAKRAFS